MKISPLSIFLLLFFQSSASFAQNAEEEHLWLITAKTTHITTYKRDTTSSFDAGGKQWAKEFHQSAKTTATGTISAIVGNQAENPAKDFLYHSDAGDPVRFTVNGNGSHTASSNGQETIDGTLISAEIRSDNVSGTARPEATLYFEFSDHSKSFDVSIGIKAVGSYSGRIYSGGIGAGEWKDYGGDYDDYGISCGGGCDALSDRNCSMTKTGKGFQGTWKERESKKHQTSNGPEYRTSETTVQITVMPYKESDKPVVTIEGCKDLGIGETGTVTATAKPLGGSYKFWVEPSDMMTVSANGAEAALTGKTPGPGVLLVEYTTPDGKTAQTSMDASCVSIESYNGGEAIPQIALYDVNGKKKSGILNVQVKAQPANAAELVKFEPADPGVLTAVGVGSEVILQEVTLGKTMLQAKTKCGAKTGPAVEVEVVNCDDETIARLEKMKKAAIENLVAAAKDLQSVAGSKEFEKARDELTSSYAKLLAKVSLTIVANGKAPNTLIKVAAEIADKGTAFSEIITSSNPEDLKDNIAKPTSGEAFERIVKNQFGEVVEGLWGKSLSAGIGVAEVSQAADKFYDNVGQLIHHEDMIEKFQEILEKADKELKNILSRQQLCGKQIEKSKDQEIPLADLKPLPKEPTPSTKPTTKAEESPVQNPQPSEPTSNDQTADDQVLIDPEFPKPPSRQVGLPYEPTDCGCDKTKDLTVSSVGFSTLGTGIKNLGDCVKDFSSITLTDYQKALEELSALTDSLSTTLNTDAGAFLTKAKESQPRLDAIIARIKAYDETGSVFLNKMEKCQESVSIGMEIFQSVEKITVDSIKTKY